MQPNSYYSHYYYWSEYIFQYFFLLSRKAQIASTRHWVEIMSEYIRLQKKDLISLKLCPSQPLGKNLNFQTSVSCCTFGTIN